MTPPIPSRSGLRARLMGIVNVTPDSFHDGGRHFDPAQAIEHGLRLADEGADLLDIGGESTRPGAPAIPAAEELARVLPVVAGLRAKCAVPLSIDTTKSEVARAAIEAGATVVNDVSGGRFDPRLLKVAAGRASLLVLGHTPARPDEMQRHARYADVVAEVAAELRRSAERARRAGVDPGSIVIDPGIGFGKTAEHSVRLLARLDALTAMGYLVLVGASRKSFVGRILERNAAGRGAGPEDRLFGSLGAAAAAVAAGAHIVLVHDVRATREALAVFEAVQAEGANGRRD
ncbi:MAG: dihydropteroate synthase [Myxococcales bacterium]|nr:dihydropteroate synthase [Myxococcales bacterium]